MQSEDPAELAQVREQVERGLASDDVGEQIGALALAETWMLEELAPAALRRCAASEARLRIAALHAVGVCSEMTIVNIHEAKTHLSRLINQVISEKTPTAAHRSCKDCCNLNFIVSSALNLNSTTAVSNYNPQYTSRLGYPVSPVLIGACTHDRKI